MLTDRRASYEKLSEAIHRAVEKHRNQMMTAPEERTESKGNPSVDQNAEAALKDAILSLHGTASAAFEAFCNADGFIGKKGWKKMVRTVLADKFSDKDFKKLKKILPKKATKQDFCTFVEGPSEVHAVARSEKRKTKHAGHADSQESESSDLATLPPEVPEVCQSCLVSYVLTDILVCLCVASSVF